MHGEGQESEAPRVPQSPERDSVKLLPQQASSAIGASAASSTFNLANTIMGSGLLTLPSAFADAGLLVGIVMAIVAAAFNVLSLHCLARAAKTRSVPARSSIGMVAEIALPGAGGVLIDVAVTAYGFGVCAAYLVVATDSLVDVTGFRTRWVWTLLSAVVVTPLTLLSSLDSLRFTSTLAIIALLTVAVVVVVYAAASTELGACGGYYDGTVSCIAPEAAPVAACPGAVQAHGRSLTATLKALSKFVLAFGCQQNILPIISELRMATRVRVSAVICCAIALALSVYLVVATAGYLTFGDLVCSNILNSYPRTATTAAARLLIACVVLTSYPLLAFEARRSLLTQFVACARAISGRRSLSAAKSLRRSSVRFRSTPQGVECASPPGAPSCAAGRPLGDPAPSPAAGAALMLTPHSRGSAAAHPEPAAPTPGTHRGGLSVGGCFVTSSEQRAVVGLYIASTFVVALSVRNLGTIVGLVGASAGMMISFIVPCACYVVLSFGWTPTRVASLFTLVLGVLLLPVCVGVELMS